MFAPSRLGRVVATSWIGEDELAVRNVARADRIWASILLGAYVVALLLSAAWTFKALPGI
jgi:hypothetical protein